MGMYTEIIFKASLKSELPSTVVDVLRYLLLENTPKPQDLPNHEFFRTERWVGVTHSGSYYHHPESVRSWPQNSIANGTYLFFRADLKDYDDEIAKFVAWITPYLDNEPGQCIGWSWYEEAQAPTLIYMPGEWAE